MKRISRQAAFILFLLEEAEKQELEASKRVASRTTAKWLKTIAHKLKTIRQDAERALPLYDDQNS